MGHQARLSEINWINKENRVMACRNCEYYDPEKIECTLLGGGRDPDGAGAQGCPHWILESEREEERREAY